MTDSCVLDHGQIFERDICDVIPSPENESLYKPVDPDDPEIRSLADSIREYGIQEPLLITVDGYIISGHRRRTAAMLAGLDKVPCRVRSINRTSDRDEFIRLLRECNRQRLKTLDEKLREEVVSASPEEAYKALIEHRRQQGRVALDAMDMGQRKERSAISDAKEPFLQAIRKVIDERRDFWPLSDRQIHYALLNHPPLVHASKKASTYRNNLKSYRALVDLLTRARIEGRIPFDVISDETRPVRSWNADPDVQSFMRRELDVMFRGYWRNLLQSQPRHIELLAEKNTVLSIIEPVAKRYCLPLTIGRGYCSLPPRHAIARRFRKSGKGRLVLLIVSDFDPDGEEIAASFARSMRDDFFISDVQAVKVALTAKQVQTFKLPPGLKAKAGSATRGKFVDRHGEHVYELEALPPADLQRVVGEAIDAVLDVQAFNHELDEEKREAAVLDATRRRVIDTLKDVA